MAAAFTTAIEAWDKQWATAEGHADWLDPEPENEGLLSFPIFFVEVPTSRQ
jgi:hypothetical protein